MMGASCSAENRISLCATSDPISMSHACTILFTVLRIYFAQNSFTQLLESFWPPSLLIGKQQVVYGTVVDGFAKFQALNFGISGPEISEGSSF